MNSNNEYFKAYQDDINRSWTRKLASEFYIQNRLIYNSIQRELIMPNFKFFTEKKYWGLWSASDTTLSISYDLLRNYEWDAVVHTLKHEMAHMVVDEIFNVDEILKNLL